MKAYTFKCDDGYRYKCLPGSCLICKNCSDVIWDYTHGPYNVTCALDKLNERYGCDCKYFKLDDMMEEWNNEEYGRVCADKEVINNEDVHQD